MTGHRLSRHATPGAARWAYDGRLLPAGIDLSLLLGLPAQGMRALLDAAYLAADETVAGPALPPIDPLGEVWASGVTYLRSREARMVESATADIYEKVYAAERPELFFKSVGWRVVGDGGTVRIRKDAAWNVPEPELVLAVNRFGEVVGYSAGNDMSSRDIEGENPLYLPQAKIYDGSCAVGPHVVLAEPEALRDLPIELTIERSEGAGFSGSIRTSQMKRRFEELARYLCLEYALPHGALLMTGTGIVPPDDFTLAAGDRIRIRVGPLELGTTVA